MQIIKNKRIIIIGVISLAIWFIIAIATFNITLRPIQNYVHSNAKIIVAITAVNDDLMEISYYGKEIIFYETYKPNDYEEFTEQYLDSLSALTDKTDSDYKRLFKLLSSTSFSKKISQSNSQYFGRYINKSYYHWKYVSKPIIKRFIKYNDFVPLKLSNKFFFSRNIDAMTLPVSKFINKISFQLVYLVHFSTIVFILGIILIIILGILVIYYVNKFFSAVKKNERRFKMMFNNGPTASLIVDIKSGDIYDANKAAETFYGYTKKELSAMNISDIALTTENKGNTEYPITIVTNRKLKNNDIKRVELTVSKIEIEDKEYFADSIRDITDKIMQENSLKESADFFKTLSENLVSGIVLYNEKYIYINPEGERILGYPKEDLYQKYVWDIYPDKNIKQIIRSQIGRRLSGGIFNSTYTLKIITKQNEERWLLISASTVKHKNKYTALASFIDVTELNKLKESLEKDMDTIKIIMENIPSIIGLYRKKIIYMNPYGLQLLGYSEKEILNLSSLDVVDVREEEREILLENMRKKLNGEYTNDKYVLKIKKKDGSIFWGEFFTSTIFFKNKWTGLAIVTDVNDRVTNELKLLKEKDVYKELAELDTLTKIPNRRAFNKTLSDSLSKAIQKKQEFFPDNVGYRPV